jgi:hypothetical protein
MMKKITLIILIGFLSLSFTKVQAQGEKSIELAPMVGFQFGGHLYFYEGEFRIDNAMNYGLNANVLIRQDHRIEFSWSMMPTTAKFIVDPYFSGDFSSWRGDVNVHYFLLGSHSEYHVSDAVILFGGVSLGASWYDAGDIRYISSNKPAPIDDMVRFAMGVTGGMKIMFSERVGIRLQGRLLMPTYFAGVGFYIGTGGSGLSLNSGSVMYQGDFQGGLVFSL